MSDVTIDFSVIQRDNPQGFCRLWEGCIVCCTDWVIEVLVEGILCHEWIEKNCFAAFE